MSVFDEDKPITHKFLIENGFRPQTYNPFLYTKILRTHTPFVILEIDSITYNCRLKWISTSNCTQILVLDKISNELDMLTIMYKYSQKNCLL